MVAPVDLAISRFVSILDYRLRLVRRRNRQTGTIDNYDTLLVNNLIAIFRLSAISRLHRRILNLVTTL